MEIQKEKAEGLWQEFKAFLGGSNVFDLAVGVVVGSALSKIVSSLVQDIIMPLIGILIGGVDFSSLTWEVAGATVNYGNFILNVVDFFIIAVCLFVCVKAMLTFRSKIDPEVDGTYKPSETELGVLKDIREELRAQREADLSAEGSK